MTKIFLKLTSAVAIAGAVRAAGSIVEVDEDLAVNLLHRGKAEVATEADAPEGLREDGPTVAEFVAAGYPAANYPPEGYASRSTDEEIAAAIAAEADSGKGKEPVKDDKAAK